MRVRRVLVYALLLAAALLYFTPFLWTVSTSLKSLPETVGFDLFPDNPSLRAYREVLTDYNFARYAFNSAFLAGTITVPTSSSARSAGTRLPVALPGPGVPVPRRAGDADDPGSATAGTRLPDAHQLAPGRDVPGVHPDQLVLAANLFLMRQYFLTIPKDFEEAAKLDGAGYFKTYWRVMLPLATPALAAVTILTFQGMWNEFFWSLIILGFGDPDRYTLQLGLAQLRFQYQTLWPQLMAASVIAILPIALIYVVFQRYFISGVVSSGVKG